tara:strand:- start:2729 stop:3523 length:795 start_codon:yes stop_codon:yes gene_type:complete
MPVVFKRPIGPVVATTTFAQWLALPKYKRPSTIAFWKGEGLDGAPIVAILTGLVLKSGNGKTGEMAQSYIVRQDMSPMDASRLGLDVSVCGTCDLRKNLVAKILAETGERKAKCYVNIGWLTKMWTGWYTGRVVWMDPVEVGKLLAYLSLALRQGAYGDPAAVPLNVWDAMDTVKGTSYSHQWKSIDIKKYAMASVKNLREAKEAQAKGWRTYRVDVEQVGPQAGEIMCPAESKGVTCAACGLCNGTRGKSAKSIVIDPIGKFN